VIEAFKAGRRTFFKVYIAKDKVSKRLDTVVSLAESLKIPVEKITASQLTSMTGTDLHQRVGARVSPYNLVHTPDVFSKIQPDKENLFLLLLDNVVDPNNLGAIIRTALCFGIDKIFIPKDRSASPTPTVSKASAGALEHVSLSRVTNMTNTIKMLKEKGLWIAGMDKDAGRSIFSVDLTGPLAVVIGGEEKGIRPLVKKHCDFLISIPQKEQIDSLNASVAGAIVMYEGFRQREYKK